MNEATFRASVVVTSPFRRGNVTASTCKFQSSEFSLDFPPNMATIDSAVKTFQLANVLPNNNTEEQVQRFVYQEKVMCMSVFFF